MSLLNPSVVVIGGELDNLMAGIRESIYARSLPLATRNTSILTDYICDPHRIDAAFAQQANSA